MVQQPSLFGPAPVMYETGWSVGNWSAAVLGVVLSIAAVVGAFECTTKFMTGLKAGPSTWKDDIAPAALGAGMLAFATFIGGFSVHRLARHIPSNEWAIATIVLVFVVAGALVAWRYMDFADKADVSDYGLNHLKLGSAGVLTCGGVFLVLIEVLHRVSASIPAPLWAIPAVIILGVIFIFAKAGSRT